MEMFSPEKAQKNAERMKKLIKEGKAASYGEADKILDEIQKKNRGKYVEDFGHEQETILRDLFFELPGISFAKPSSVYDDQKAEGKKIDLIVTLDNEKEIAVQIAGTGDLDKQREKIGELIRYPFLKELHTDTGEVIPLKEIMPRCIGYMDKVKLGHLYNQFKGGKISREKMVYNKETLGLLNSMATSLRYGKNYAQLHAREFDESIRVIEKSIKLLEKNL